LPSFEGSGHVVFCTAPASRKTGVSAAGYSLFHIRVRAFAVFGEKRSIRAVTTGSGTEPSSSTASEW
jgi:hypothetical protein